MSDLASTLSLLAPADDTPEAVPNIIETRGLGVSYNGKPAVTDVSLALPRGRILALMGPSGCGKSSVLAALNRMTDLIPGCTVAGAIRFGSEEVLSERCDLIALRRRIGLIFQRPNPFPLSIHRNLDLPLREHGIPRAEREGRIEEALRQVELWAEVKDRLGASALNLSGGQQQRLCIARALVLEPEILLLDEPCSALDPIAAGVIEDLLASLRAHCTQVIVTHNLAQARRLADHAALFWTQGGVGGVVEAGPARELFDAPRKELTRLYLAGECG